jgi:hypothetical protein
MSCCPLCYSMEAIYLTRIPYERDEEADCEVLEADDDE